MMKIRMPDIKGRSPEEQVKEMKAYLYQLVKDLNWALSALEKSMEETRSKEGNSNG